MTRLTVHELLKLLLGSRGHQTDHKPNGKEALAFLNSCDDLPDVILVDLRMPVMDGNDFLESLRLDPRLRDIPTLIMSADDKYVGDAHGHNRMLVKPLSMSSVLDAVRRDYH